MVGAHVTDAWTRLDDRNRTLYMYTVFIAGMAAPLFLFLAGLTIAMAASSRAVKVGHSEAAAQARRRGLQVYALAFLFRLQSQLLGWGALINFLKVDILNVMGIAMFAAAIIWGLSANRIVRMLLFAIAIVGVIPDRVSLGFLELRDNTLRLALLKRGRERFDIYCSVCHGRTGDGNGMIVRRGFRQPPSYHIDRLRQAPAGHFFDVMTKGIGAMPSYANRIEVGDRWAIVAYIRALQLSQNAPLDDVPADERDKLLSAMPAAKDAAPGLRESPP